MSMTSKTSISKNTHNVSGNLRVGMLEGLGFINSSVGGWSFLFQISKYFDPPSRRLWETSRNPRDILTPPQDAFEKPSRNFEII